MGLLHVFQEKLIFLPEEIAKNYAYDFPFDFEEVNLKTADNETINALHLKAENPKGIILFFHGNQGNLIRWGAITSYFTQFNYDVFVIDYRGYGKSTGFFNETNMYADALLSYEHVKKQFLEKNIIVYGRSLGTGLATKVASMNNPRMLVLACPYFSMSKNVKRYLPFIPLGLVMRYQMPTYKWIKYVDCPINIIHGTSDKVIKFTSSLRLSKMRPNLTRLYPVIDLSLIHI